MRSEAKCPNRQAGSNIISTSLLEKFARSQSDRRGPPGFWVNERFSIDPTYEVVPNQIKDLEELLSKTENRV